MDFSKIVDGSKMAAHGLRDFASGLARPTVRLGITGLARAGKTVFITAFVNALLSGASLPLFEAHARGRIKRVYLEPQPDDHLPRFAFEDHLASLGGEHRGWPQSTRRISQLRLTVEYEPLGLVARSTHGGLLHIDIIDYPGEWLLDLPLLSMNYQQWASKTVIASRQAPRNVLAMDWHGVMSDVSCRDPADEHKATQLAAVFTSYLARCRNDDVSLSSLPPGRFLMPGDLEGSPLLTFAPLDIASDETIESGSMAALMARRYDAYVSKVVKPFFYDHFARLDRQIILVDVLSALNAGATAVNDLKSALTDILGCFRQGPNTVFSQLFGRRVDKLVFAATKADLLHHASHDRLEAILGQLVAEAKMRADILGVDHHAAAIAAIRATREATIKSGGDALDCIVGIPTAGETISGKAFDGLTEAAIFPGDLPADSEQALTGELAGKLRFVKFRPPQRDGKTFPHIRLDRVIEFVIGDKFE
jgi:uncharacterized protein